jgi:hypothetical protein
MRPWFGRGLTHRVRSRELVAAKRQFWWPPPVPPRPERRDRTVGKTAHRLFEGYRVRAEKEINPR